MSDKLSKSEVNYRKSASSRRCGNCSMFERSWSAPAQGKCTLVAGDIHFYDVCDRWEPK